MKNKEAIVILGGWLIKDKDNNWRTTTFNENDDSISLGDRLRVVAGSFLYKNDRNQFLIASGGKGKLKDVPNIFNVSAIIKKELIELGVPANKIIEENKSNNTYEQLQELKKIIKNKRLNQIIIISNGYHLPRLEAMINIDIELKKLFKEAVIKLKSAEEVVLKYDPEKWRDIINNAYSSQAMKKRIKLEEKGVRDINIGKYILK